jgi:citrate lyase subunit beta/citryl-CoA lyase
MMFLPGNSPRLVRDAYIYGADCLMFDLEDSIALGEKDSARMLVYQALKSIDYGGTERIVRINPLSTPFGRKDIEAAVRGGVDAIRIAKTETPQDVLDVEAEIERVERAAGVPAGRTRIMAAIEGPLGVIHAHAIATASPRMMGIALGAEDYCANMKVTRTQDGQELVAARQHLVIAARAAGIAAIDTVFSDLNDMEGFCRETRFIKTLGFDGKSVINPRQIKPVHDIFAPTAQEIAKASRIVAALREAQGRGSGVISLDGKMVDRPVVLRAQRVLDIARACGLLGEGEGGNSGMEVEA